MTFVLNYVKFYYKNVTKLLRYGNVLDILSIGFKKNMLEVCIRLPAYLALRERNKARLKLHGRG